MIEPWSDVRGMSDVYYDLRYLPNHYAFSELHLHHYCLHSYSLSTVEESRQRHLRCSSFGLAMSGSLGTHGILALEVVLTWASFSPLLPLLTA